MKIEIIKVIGMVLGGIFGIIFIGYLIISFTWWTFSDPFHLMKPADPFPVVKNPDVVKCREIGGYPDISVWDGSLKECKKLELK